MNKRFFIIVILFFAFLNQAYTQDEEIIRISVVSLKNFGDSKADDKPRLKFIADRIAEQAVKGICVVDELQDSDGSAIEKLHKAVTNSAHVDISMAVSKKVGASRKEQFGFFWNKNIVDMVGAVKTIDFEEIERDSGMATFKAKAGFDFTLCAFHTRPEGKPLRDELAFLDDLFMHFQALDNKENDILFVGDFNAPPNTREKTKQNAGISEMMGTFSSNIYFTIQDKPTNVRQNKIFDNIFFDKNQTDEYISDGQHIVRIDQMLDRFTGEIPDHDRVGWFLQNVMDHCPIYANFRADIDTD